MLSYKIKPEFWYKWGAETDDTTRVTLNDMKNMADVWEISLEEVREQVEEVN